MSKLSVDVLWHVNSWKSSGLRKHGYLAAVQAVCFNPVFRSFFDIAGMNHYTFLTLLFEGIMQPIASRAGFIGISNPGIRASFFEVVHET